MHIPLINSPEEKRLRRWLSETNFPEGFYWTLVTEMYQGRAVCKVRLTYDLEKFEFLIDPFRLIRSDFDYIIETAIRRMKESADMIKEK